LSKIRIIGIDPGAKRCGYSIIEFSLEEEKFVSPQYVTSGIFGLGRNDEEGETYSAYKMRLIPNTVEVFQDLLDEYQPDLAVFEFLPVSNVGAASGQRLLAFAVATSAQVLCEQNGIPWTEITAVTVKKQLTDVATATKAVVKRAVLEVFPDLKSNKYLADETDALAIPLAWTKRKNTEH
jgi:Holliday junction resolvasome RuvABC endonuclease subunit